MQVFATAGHVDHGKSTLLRVLTKVDPDRWPEERQRGLTIDLGFVWTDLPGGTRVAFVDVPGHQRLLGNTLAGFGSAPAVLFVVAADDGWMPQSEEHLAALDAFGVRSGLLVVTRIDRVSAEVAQAVTDDAVDRIGRTGLGRFEAVQVSAVTGVGLEPLVSRLESVAARMPLPDAGAPVRLWLDRAFSIAGAGTVVTGTLTAGRLTSGDVLELSPGHATVRVRGLQSLGRQVRTVDAPARVAVNLRRVPVSDVRRGYALVTPGRWSRTNEVDVRLRPGVAADELPAEPLVHCGTAVTAARVRRLGGAMVRLRFDTELPLHVGDRLVIRDPGRRLLVGADVLDVAPPVLRRRGAAAARAQELEDGHDVRRQGEVAPVGDPERLPAGVDALRTELEEAPFRAPTRERLKELGLTRSDLAIAVRLGALQQIGDLYLLPGSATRAAAMLHELPGPFSVGECCRALDTSRRVAIPLLEHLDEIGLTVRDPSGRRSLLRPSLLRPTGC